MDGGAVSKTLSSSAWPGVGEIRGAFLLFGGQRNMPSGEGASREGGI